MPTFLDLQREVQMVMEAGRPLDDAEQIINDSSLREDQKAALWLYAWSFVPEHRQHHLALRYMEELDDQPSFFPTS